MIKKVFKAILRFVLFRWTIVLIGSLFVLIIGAVAAVRNAPQATECLAIMRPDGEFNMVDPTHGTIFHASYIFADEDSSWGQLPFLYFDVRDNQLFLIIQTTEGSSTTIPLSRPGYREGTAREVLWVDSNTRFVTWVDEDNLLHGAWVDLPTANVITKPLMDRSMRYTRNGDFWFSVAANKQWVLVGAFDTDGYADAGIFLFWSPSTGRRVSFPVERGFIVAGGYMHWSGSQLAVLEGRIPGATSRSLLIFDPEHAVTKAFLLTDSPEIRLNWSPDGAFMAVRYFEPPYWRVDVLGMKGGPNYYDLLGAVPIDDLPRRSGDPALNWSANGDLLMYLRERGVAKYDLWQLNIRTGEVRVVLRDVSEPLYADSQHRMALFTVRSGKLTLLDLADNAAEARVVLDGIDDVATVEMLDSGLLFFVARIAGASRVYGYTLATHSLNLITEGILQINQLLDGTADEGYFTFRWQDTMGNWGMDVYSRDGRRLARFNAPFKSDLYPRIAPNFQYAVISDTQRMGILGVKGGWTELPQSAYTDFEWSTNSRYLAILDRNGTVMIYDVAQGTYREYKNQINDVGLLWVPCRLAVNQLWNLNQRKLYGQ